MGRPSERLIRLPAMEADVSPSAQIRRVRGLASSASSLRVGTSRVSADLPVVALTVVAAVLYSVHLGGRSLWLDEVVSATYAHEGFSVFWHTITHADPNMSLYYVLLRLWTHVVGYSEAGLRSLSVLAGALSVPLMAAVGSKLFGRRVGLLGALLLALSPLMLVYAQEARSYSMLVLVTLGATLLFLRAMDEPTAGRLCAYVVVAAVSFYIHYFAALVLVVHLLALLVRGAWREAPRRWLIAAVVIAAGCAPEIFLAARRSQNLAWVTQPTLGSLRTFGEFLVSGQTNLGHVTELAAAAFLLLAFGGAYFQYRSGSREQSLFALGWLVVPVALNVLISSTGHSFWVFYYMIIALPPLLLLIAAGITAFRAPVISAAVTCVCVLLLAAWIAKAYDAPATDNYRDATRYLVSNARPGDATVYGTRLAGLVQLGQMDPGVEWYAQRMHRAVPRLVSVTSLANPGERPHRVFFEQQLSETSSRIARRVERMLLADHYHQVGPRHTFGGHGPAVFQFVLSR
jgi:mannosyltransferase